MAHDGRSGVWLDLGLWVRLEEGGGMPLDSFSQLATTIRTRLTTPKQMQYFAECTEGGDLISQQTSWRHDCQQEV